MKAVVDMHTHTVASGHAYSTLKENIEAAKKKGLKIYGVSDHAPKMPGTAHLFHFSNLKVIPRDVGGLTVLKGVELNVLNGEGDIDLTAHELQGLDYAIISLHTPCYDDLGPVKNAEAMVKAMRHMKVKIVGHPDDSRLPVDYDILVRGAKEHGVFIEVNNSSLSPNSFRSGAHDNYLKLLALCKAYEVPVIMGSDAHHESYVGVFNFSRKVLEDLAFPESLIVNDHPEYIEAFLNESEE